MAIILDSTGTHSVCFITKNYTGQSCSRVRQVFVLKSKCFIFAMIFMKEEKNAIFLFLFFENHVLFLILQG